MAGWLVGWLVGGWLVGWLVAGWLVGWVWWGWGTVCFCGGHMGWLARLGGWLVDEWGGAIVVSGLFPTFLFQRVEPYTYNPPPPLPSP